MIEQPPTLPQSSEKIPEKGAAAEILNISIEPNFNSMTQALVKLDFIILSKMSRGVGNSTEIDLLSSAESEALDIFFGRLARIRPSTLRYDHPDYSKSLKEQEDFISRLNGILIFYPNLSKFCDSLIDSIINFYISSELLNTEQEVHITSRILDTIDNFPPRDIPRFLELFMYKPGFSLFLPSVISIFRNSVERQVNQGVELDDKWINTFFRRLKSSLADKDIDENRLVLIFRSLESLFRQFPKLLLIDDGFIENSMSLIESGFWGTFSEKTKVELRRAGLRILLDSGSMTRVLEVNRNFFKNA